MKKVSTFSGVLLAVVGLSACAGASHDMSTMSGAVMPGSTDPDVMFVQGMIPHHEQAVVMADLALDPAAGASQEVVALATRIKNAQAPEIELMNSWLTSWSVPPQTDMTGGAMDHSNTGGMNMDNMMGMMSTEEMTTLKSSTGAAFDTAWLNGMIKHHQGAIMMAYGVKTSGKNPEVINLADQIILSQTAEIAEMQGMLGK
ncbi:MAG: DUF305 domain-containing protein [Acidimicrobiaceae bacterium]|nr:DUF305 domain-containing protein [Acidimicrobiaceae bacterium]